VLWKWVFGEPGRCRSGDYLCVSASSQDRSRARGEQEGADERQEVANKGCGGKFHSTINDTLGNPVATILPLDDSFSIYAA
jgi:hypothetical protein